MKFKRGYSPVILFTNCDQPLSEYLKNAKSYDGIDLGAGRQIIWDKYMFSGKFVKDIGQDYDFSCIKLELVDPCEVQPDDDTVMEDYYLYGF